MIMFITPVVVAHGFMHSDDSGRIIGLVEWMYVARFPEVSREAVRIADRILEKWPSP
jgi:dTDP-4-dehydrorhamnose 3,5-epimerase-like enzyme